MRVAVCLREVVSMPKMRLAPSCEGKQIGTRFSMTFHSFQTIDKLNDLIETLR